MPSARRFHADLLPFLSGDGVDRKLHHPLIVRPVPDDRAADVINRMYAERKRRLGAARHAGNWQEFIWIHEPEFRPRALIEIASELDDATYWRLVSRVWCDSTSINGNLDAWITLWKSQRLFREQIAFTPGYQIPDVVDIWRNAADRNGNELSWSPSYELASGKTAARRKPRIVAGIVERIHVRAWFADRMELVVLPSDYQIVSTTHPLAEASPPNAVRTVV